VMMVGDSTVFCAEVPDEETTASHLARFLEGAGHPVSVLNAGVRGYSTVQSKRMMAECLQRYPSVRVAVYCYCDNDWFENLRPKEYWPAVAPTVRRDPGTGEIVEVDVLQCAVPWGESFLPAMEEERAQRQRRIRHKRWDRRMRDRRPIV